MKNHYLTIVLTILSIIGLNAQGITEKHVFSENAKATFKKMTTSESTLDWMRIKESEKVSKEKFLQKSKEIFDLNEKTNFTEIKVNEAKNGWKHHRLQQMYEGIPIEGAHYLLHEKDGLIETANGNVIAGLELSTTPAISEEIALQMLLNEIGANKYAWESEEHATELPKGELVIATTTDELKTEDLSLGYKFKVKTIDPLSHAEYIIDAFTGGLIYQNSLLCQYDVQGNCQTHRYGEVSVTMDFDGTNYRLKQNARNIEMYNGNGQNSENVSYVHFTNPTNNWTTYNSACEAYWVLENTHDYYLNEHNWNGYDDYGSRLTAWTYVGNNWNNAQGGGGEIYLGEGDGINYGPFTAIDIVAHEFTHSVIQSTANLQYVRESGALNESFADIFGTMVEFYIESNGGDWLLGEDIVINGGAFRNMSDPSLLGDPSTYEDGNWIDITSNCSLLNDNCGVHSNSGVQNHWFYILANGKSGTNYFGYNYDVAGIGMDKAAQLALENLKNYLGPFSDYIDARNGAIEAANALNFTANEKNQVEEAWCAVGLGDCSITTTGTITVTSPNGGELLNQGIAENITWNRTGSTGAEVKIEYSINAGNEWQVITEATTNDGTYQWFPPSVETNLALVRVSSLSNETIFDSSDDYFGVNICAVRASFNVSNEQPCANETVTFNTTSTGGANTYQWYINGSLSHTGPTFNYNFSQAGNYEIELRATVSSTCGDVEVFNLSVQPNANANFTYDATFETISFISPDNHFDATYSWTTGDGIVYDSPNLSKAFVSAGSYTVCLTVNSSCGSDNECKVIDANIYGCTDATACNYDDSATVDDNTCIYGNCNNCLEADSLVLVALYNATNGPNWGMTWNLSQPLNTWHGVWISECHVTRLDLDDNNLTGFIPIELGNLENLQYLNLQFNNLTGIIPEQLGNLQNLQHLDLHLNNLTGTIPEQLGNLQNLQFINLRSSGLTGSIPSELGNSQNLLHLNLYDNNLTGSIPPELGNLQNLQYLNLYDNNLTGSIPSELGNLENLKTLWLANNDLTGTIPTELGNLFKLRDLSLNVNNLIGFIPPELGNLLDLRYLYLSDNNLIGTIPPELGNLQNLQYLFLPNNNLTGCYPTSLCNLTLYDFSYTGNSDLPDNGSDQGFQDFCNGTTPCGNTSEVYPGDLNFDGITNHKDILSFGIYNGEFGLERAAIYQNINWSGHPSTDWGAIQENSSEIKHTDADGNGVVDLRDVQAIETNYGKTHTASPITTLPNNNSNSPIEVTLEASAVPSFIGNDNQVVFDIKVEDVNSSDLALYGGYFTIDYDDAFISDIEVVFNPSWFGIPDQNIEYIVYNDDANNKIDIGITKVDHQNSIGEGTIGQVIATVDNDTPWDAITLNFLVSDIGMQDAESFALPVGASTTVTTFDVSQTDCESSINITSSTSLGNHYAQNLIQTNGNILINNSQDITFGSDRLKVNDGLTVKDGGEFTYFNDPCGTANRGVNSIVGKRLKSNQLFKTGNYKIAGNQLIFDLDLIKEGKVYFEILDNSNDDKTNKFEFGERQQGTQQFAILLDEITDNRFYVCLKVGSDRYYFEIDY